jgi:polysaccharide biosynthesis/export protein VpsN
MIRRKWMLVRGFVSVVLLMWAVLGLAQTAPVEANLPTASQFLSVYKLGAGDVVSIRVFGEDDLSREKIRLTDTGSIFMPGLGELTVRGKTLGEVEKLVVDGLRGRILVNPKVSVSVEEYRPFFINGMVDKPGGYPFQPGLTVRKAASLAGGFKERASLNKLFLIRGDDPQQKQFKAELNTPVFPGDIVTVEESFF